MKRSVIQLAGKTHVVSLPSKWVHRHGIKKGDELDITEKENHLLIRTGTTPAYKTISVNLHDLNERTIRHYLSSLHKSGYDEIAVLYDSPKTISIIHDLLKNLFIGFAILEQTSKRCVLKSISHDISEEFNPTLRRAFLVTLSLADATLEHLRRKNYTALKELIMLENTNNQLTNFCERIINKYAYEEKNTFLYVTAWNLEKIADEYKYLCNALATHTQPLSPALLDVHARVNTLFKGYYTLFYAYDLKLLNDLATDAATLLHQSATLRPKNLHEQQLLNILTAITRKTVDFSTSIIALHHQHAAQENHQ